MFTVSFRNHKGTELANANLKYLPRIGEKIVLLSSTLTIYDIIYMPKSGLSATVDVLVYVR